MLGSFRLALCQTLVTKDVVGNLIRAQTAIERAAQAGAALVVLPECFLCPYGHDSFRANAEPVPDPGDSGRLEGAVLMLKEAARKNRIWIIGGSIPEKAGLKLYNTCTVFNNEGNLIAKYRKIHLFNVDIPGKMTFRESDTFSAGATMTTFKFQSQDVQCKVGLGICYDLRFPEFIATLARSDCSLLVFPGAFNLTTGSAHWELLIRSRALDNQVYVAAVSPARNESSSYRVWGHSTLCGPWGDVQLTTGHDPDLLIADVDLDLINNVRRQIPIRDQKRPDLYKL